VPIASDAPEDPGPGRVAFSTDADLDFRDAVLEDGVRLAGPPVPDPAGDVSKAWRGVDRDRL
jgi:hypothetical protein